jgi:creatinine amidohydrolase
MRELNLFDLPHAEAHRLLTSGAPVYLTINPVEYHGPHLSLHNDRLVSLGLIRELHQRLAARHADWPLVLATDLEIGVEPCPGIGSRHTPFSAARELVIEACRALAELGARRVVLMTFHGSPLHNLAIESGIELLVERGVHAVAPFNLVLREMLTVDGDRYAPAFAHVEDPGERAAMIRDLRFDFHAGFFETSMALHYAPESVAPSYRELPPCPPIVPDPPLAVAAHLARRMRARELADELELAAMGRGWYAIRPFYGYTGRPHRATAQAGALFARAILDQYEPMVEAVLDGRERSPQPIMAWVEAITFGGRLNALHVPIDQMLRLNA